MIETSSVPPGNLREIFGKSSENVRRRSSSLRNNFGKSSEIFGKWSEIFGKSSKTSLLVCLYNKQNNMMDAWRYGIYLFRVHIRYLTRSTSLYNRGTFRWYATLENKTPAEMFPKFPSVLRYNTPGLSNRTKPNKKPIEPNRSPIVRLGSAIEQNRTPLLLRVRFSNQSNQYNRTKSNKIELIQCNCLLTPQTG